MTLVPIIYASLLIFSALLLFVLLFSYISFKAKSSFKKNVVVVPSLNQEVQKRQSAIHIPHAPIVIKKESTALQHRKIQIEHSRPEQIPIPTMERVGVDYSKRGNEHRYYSAKNLYHNNSKPTREDRIVIVNDPQKFQPARPARIVNGQKSSQRLPDLNLLNYYSDRTDTEFITLTA